MKIVKDTISISDLKEVCKNGPFAEVVKTVVDIEKKIMAIDAEVHAELRELLIREEDSHPQYLWGINLVPDRENEGFIVFDSLINLKPGLNNRTRGIEDAKIRGKITAIINHLIKR